MVEPAWSYADWVLLNVHGKIAMQVTLRQLEIFIAVVEEQQVTRASKKLFITQSAVSLALNELENQLGGPLFDRDSRSLHLNDRGRYLLPRCREILYKANNICTLMNEKEGNMAGALNIVASSTIGNYVLPAIVSTFKNLYPHTFITVQIHNTRLAEQLIVERKVDLGFVEGEVNNEQVKVSPWFDDELVIIANPGNTLSSSNKFNLTRDMKSSTWVMREKGSGTAQIFKKKLGKFVTELNVVMELGHTEAIKKAVQSGNALGCLSNLTVCGEIDRGELKELYLEGVDMKRSLLIIQHKNKVNTKLMDEFLGFCEIMGRCSQEIKCFSSPDKIKVLQEQLQSTGW
jgi:DNA-binding transcriptional LysR family regulator